MSEPQHRRTAFELREDVTISPEQRAELAAEIDALHTTLYPFRLFKDLWRETYDRLHSPLDCEP